MKYLFLSILSIVLLSSCKKECEAFIRLAHGTDTVYVFEGMAYYKHTFKSINQARNWTCEHPDATIQDLIDLEKK